MGIFKELLLFSGYFLILSTVSQSQDAFVFFYNSKKESTEGVEDHTSRARKLILYLIIATLAYLTLLVTPYIKVSVRKLLIGGLTIILLKYACELMTFTNILKGLFELAAIICDVIGQSIFYLASARMIQIICERHSQNDQTGRLFALFGCLYAMSILLGYAVAYGAFKMLPVWLFLIILTSMTALSGVFCYFAFKEERRPVNQLQEESQEGANPNAEPIADANRQRQQNGALINRQIMSLGSIYRQTLTMYKKMLLILPIQITLGIYISYSLNLLEYLVWQTQIADSVDQKLMHNLEIIILLCGGALLMCAVIGFLCDWLSMKKVGIWVVILMTSVFVSLFLGIHFKKLTLTSLLYAFVGMSIFGMATWILCACSKIFGGRFQAFSVAAQFIGMAMFAYDIFFILLQGKVSLHLRLNLQLGILVICGIACYLFMRRLPSGQLEIIFQEAEINPDYGKNNAEPKPDIEMKQQEMNQDKIQEQLQKKDEPTINPDLLI